MTNSSPNLRSRAERAFADGRVDEGLNLLLLLAHRILLEGQNPKSILNEIVERSGGQALYLERCGELLFQQGNYDDARAAFHAVLERQPDRVNSIVALAVIYAREGRLEEAPNLTDILDGSLHSRVVELFKKTVGYQLGDANSHLRLGRLYRQLGSFEKAIREFVSASHNPTQYLICCNEMALTFRDAGYSEAAVRLWIEALQATEHEDEDFSEILYNLFDS